MEKIKGAHRKTDKWGYNNHKELVCHYAVEILTEAEPACLIFVWNSLLYGQYNTTQLL